MQRRLFKLCTLLVSLALMALPVQQAFADSSMNQHMQDSDAAPAHCHDGGNTTGVQQTLAKAVSNTDVAGNACCCEQCDKHCQPDCSSHAVSALLPDTPVHKQPLSPTVFVLTRIVFSTHGYAPPSPPPLG